MVYFFEMRYLFDNVTFPSPGKCIYCLGISNLTDEHIIPYSLSGGFVLKNASCPKCADITKAFEQICARDIYGPLRIAHAYPSRRKKERPKLLPLEIEVAGQKQTRMVPVDEYPSSPLVVPIFPRAGILIGRAQSEEIPDIQYQLVFPLPPDQNERLQNLRGDGPTNVTLQLKFALNPFMRLLAKIAHGFGVAEYGLGSFEPLLPNFILDRDSRLSHVIGNASHTISFLPEHTHEKDLPSRHAFQVGIRSTGGHHYVSVLLQLFRYLDLPVYEIIVGLPTQQLLNHVFQG